MDLDDDTHREDQSSSSCDTPVVTATHKEPTGMRPKFFEESILMHKREIERLHQQLAEGNPTSSLTIGQRPTSPSLQSSPAELRTGTPGISSLGPISKQRDG
jgi:hypothetical protein